MLQVMRSNNWFPSLFDEFYNTAFGTSNRVATPAVNVIEDAKAYTMEFAVPGVTKEFCRVSINADGNLEVAIESKLEHKGEDKHEHYLRRSQRRCPCHHTAEDVKGTRGENSKTHRNQMIPAF